MDDVVPEEGVRHRGGPVLRCGLGGRREREVEPEARRAVGLGALVDPVGRDEVYARVDVVAARDRVGSRTGVVPAQRRGLRVARREDACPEVLGRVARVARALDVAAIDAVHADRARGGAHGRAVGQAREVHQRRGRGRRCRRRDDGPARGQVIVGGPLLLVGEVVLVDDGAAARVDGRLPEVRAVGRGDRDDPGELDAAPEHRHVHQPRLDGLARDGVREGDALPEARQGLRRAAERDRDAERPPGGLDRLGGAEATRVAADGAAEVRDGAAAGRQHGAGAPDGDVDDGVVDGDAVDRLLVVDVRDARDAADVLVGNDEVGEIGRGEPDGRRVLAEVVGGRVHRGLGEHGGRAQEDEEAENGTGSKTSHVGRGWLGVASPPPVSRCVPRTPTGIRRVRARVRMAQSRRGPPWETSLPAEVEPQSGALSTAVPGLVNPFTPRGKHGIVPHRASERPSPTRRLGAEAGPAAERRHASPRLHGRPPQPRRRLAPPLPLRT